MNTMNYQLLGRSSLRVSDLCLGTMTFGDDWGWGSPKEEAKKIYDAFREAGGNFIDTANLPCPWDFLTISWLAWCEIPCSAACVIGSRPEFPQPQTTQL